MIRSVTFSIGTEPNIKSMTVPLSSYENNSGFTLINITGAGPVNANIATTEMVTTDGALFNSARLGYRNLVFTFIFDASQTIEAVRHMSYAMFPVKKKISMLFETDERTLEAEGYVESNDVTIFSSACGTTVSVICPDPFFRDPSPIVVGQYAVEKRFEFPFYNKKLNEKTIIFGVLDENPILSVNYEGDDEVGVNLQLTLSGEPGDITITKQSSDPTLESMVISANAIALITQQGGPQNGDIIDISTSKGRKSISLLRGNLRWNILNSISSNASWFQLTKGINNFNYYGSLTSSVIGLSITYYSIYEGI